MPVSSAPRFELMCLFKNAGARGQERWLQRHNSRAALTGTLCLSRDGRKRCCCQFKIAYLGAAASMGFQALGNSAKKGLRSQVGRLGGGMAGSTADFQMLCLFR
jgi:hypothetical protein